MVNELVLSSRRGLIFAMLCVALSACAKGHVVDESTVVPEEPARIPSAMETIVTTTVVPAGSHVHAECRVYDQDGERMLELEGATPRIVHEPQYLFVADGDDLIAAKVGLGNVACTFAQYGLFDEGVEVEIVAGPPHSAIARLDDDQIAAGETASATCFVYDAYGNELEDVDAALTVAPSASGVVVSGLTATVTRSGTYEVTCGVGGAPLVESDFLHVNPGLPHSMTVGLRPERPYFKVHDLTLLEADVRDRYGNRVTGAALAYSEESNDLSTREGARFTFETNGATVLRATVTSPIDPEVGAVTASVPVIVNTSGPDIECLHFVTRQPSDAYMVNRAPGAVQVPVRVSDTFNVASVRIGGHLATNVGDGVYQVSYPLHWGMNFVDVVATDEHGLDNSRTCFFLASNDWTAEDAMMAGTVGFKLTQAAVGPGTPGQLTTLNEIIRVVLNSSGLKSMVDQGLPGLLNDGDCGIIACVPDVNYNRGTLNWDTVTTSLDLINGGLRLGVVLPQVRLQVRACGTTCCIGGSTITARVSQIAVGVDVSLGITNGQLRAGISGTPSVTVSTPSLDGSGFCGFLIGLIQGFFTGTVRDAVQSALQDFLTNDVGTLLDDLVSSLDVSSLGSSFDVPRLDGSGNIALGFGIGLSSFDIAASNRALIGIDTRFTASPVAHNRATLGVARRPGNILLDTPVSSPRTLGLSFYEGALNQVVHALWRGGFFNATLEMGPGTNVSIDAFLPPVVHIEGNAARLALGGIHSQIQLAIGGATLDIEVMFGGVAGATVALEGDSLTFGDVTLDVENDLYITILSDAIPEEARDILTLVLGNVLKSVLLDAVNEGLPAIPIPTFQLPADLATFGLPANAELGITNATLGISGNHFRLQGGFGVR